MRHALALCLFLAACADPFADAEKANTIEAWEGYLASGSASGSEQRIAEAKLSKLIAEKAKVENTVAAYSAYLDRFPKGIDAEELGKLRIDAAYADAEKANTAEVWGAFLTTYPEADARMRKKAEGFRAVGAYGGVRVDAPVVSEVNLANDPKGPKNGWEIRTTVTNTGDKSITWLNLTAFYLDANGKRVSSVSYPVVAKSGPGGMPIEEMYQEPLAPGKSRTWSYATGEFPPEWSKKADVLASGIQLEADAGK